MFVEFQISLNSRYNAPVNPTGGFCDYVTSNGINTGDYLGTYGSRFLSTFGCNSSTNYDFLVGVVTKQKGIYSLDLLGGTRAIARCPNKISGFPPSSIEFRFNVVDGNKDVYLSIPYDSRRESTTGYTESKIDSKEVYVV